MKPSFPLGWCLKPKKRPKPGKVSLGFIYPLKPSLSLVLFTGLDPLPPADHLFLASGLRVLSVWVYDGKG
jgi:hypothetical protein